MTQEPTTAQTEPNNAPPSPVDELVEQLVGIGSEWAVFGLQCGQTALERSARSLRLAARTLSTLSRSIERKTHIADEEAPPAEPAKEGTPEPTITADPSAL